MNRQANEKKMKKRNRMENFKSSKQVKSECECHFVVVSKGRKNVFMQTEGCISVMYSQDWRTTMKVELESVT